MAYWARRRRYGRYRRGYRRTFRRYFRRYSRKFINGSSKSTVRVKIPMHDYDSFNQAAGAVGTSTGLICPFLASTVRSSPLNSGLYQTYCNLYDEVKCIGMKIKINVTSQVGGQDIPSLQIYTAFDRRRGQNDDIPTYNTMKTFSTFQVATAVNNSVAKLTRSIYASDLLEKAQWHDCSLATNAGTTTDAAYVASGDNPNFFVPGFYLAFAVPGLGAGVGATVNCTYDIMYYFAFRNPKWGGAAGNSKLEIESVEGTRRNLSPDGDDDVDMEAIGADLENEDRVPVTAVNIARKAGGAEAASQARRAARAKNALSRRSEGLPG